MKYVLSFLGATFLGIVMAHAEAQIIGQAQVLSAILGDREFQSLFASFKSVGISDIKLVKGNEYIVTASGPSGSCHIDVSTPLYASVTSPNFKVTISRTDCP